MSSIPAYDQVSLEDLRARTQYESWLLEAVYDVAESPVLVDWPDQMVYPASGAIPALSVFGRANIIIGDWRPRFLEVGAPLVFVNSFKLLDMLLEWVLERNGTSSTYRFVQKITALKQGVTFPPFFASRTWLRDRLIGLYEHLEPLRGTIIHARHFKTSDGTLRVSNSKSSTVGPEVTITADELRRLAVLAVSLLRYVDGSWVINPYKEKYLRHTLDEIEHLHGLSFLGQKPPRFLTVRVFAKWSDSIKIDLKRIHDDIARMCSNQDVVFDLRVVTVNTDGSKATGYLFPWDEINGERAQLVRAVVDIAHLQSPLPDDIDTARVSQELNMSSGEHRIAG
ncbi:MAG: hypothetical protein JRE64_17805 [Deltaproteobacteria bacterium]|nr:hypothetical protein [Deltaproteobacteria bacterium]